VLDALNGRARELIDAVGLSDFEGAWRSSCPTAQAGARDATTLALDPE